MVRPGGQSQAPISRLRPLRPRQADRFRRLIVAAAAAAFAFVPAVASASPTPSPRPSLETLLVAPPESDYQESPEALSLNGAFDMEQYLTFLGPKDVSETTSDLRREGFISGFSQTWVQQASNHLLVEVVIAFAGKKGAREWLGKSEQVDKADSYYKSSIPMSGLDAYYGARFADDSRALYADIISFVKGNDYFLVGLVSTADDLGDAASQQTRRQYDKAPPYTIPPSQWPESAGSFLIGPLAIPATTAYVGGGTIAVILLAGAAALVLVLRRQRRAVPAVAAWPRMSDDGAYWWDGDAWRDAEREAPPDALRSDDGHYWWDGARWRLLDQPAS